MKTELLYSFTNRSKLIQFTLSLILYLSVNISMGLIAEWNTKKLFPNDPVVWAVSVFGLLGILVPIICLKLFKYKYLLIIIPTVYLGNRIGLAYFLVPIFEHKDSESGILLIIILALQLLITLILILFKTKFKFSHLRDSKLLLLPIVMTTYAIWRYCSGMKRKDEPIIDMTVLFICILTYAFVDIKTFLFSNRNSKATA